MPLTDDELRFTSRYFIYHVKMYVETYKWLEDHQEKPLNWDTIRNAILEDHLIHVRVLICFFFPKQRETDVVATDYFYDIPGSFLLSDDEFLKGQASNIGGHLVHLTTKPMPTLKSKQDWPIFEIKDHLVPEIMQFLSAVPENRLESDVKNKCRFWVSSLKHPSPCVSLNASS